MAAARSATSEAAVPSPPCRRWGAGALRSPREGYARRMAADPSFRHKSLLEIMLAVLTQCVAEFGIRGGRGGMVAEFDFVFAGGADRRLR
jgi:hypothetical protein